MCLYDSLAIGFSLCVQSFRRLPQFVLSIFLVFRRFNLLPCDARQQSGKPLRFCLFLLLPDFRERRRFRGRKLPVIQSGKTYADVDDGVGPTAEDSFLDTVFFSGKASSSIAAIALNAATCCSPVSK